jgi:hypothetical protein
VFFVLRDLPLVGLSQLLESRQVGRALAGGGTTGHDHPDEEHHVEASEYR